MDAAEVSFGRNDKPESGRACDRPGEHAGWNPEVVHEMPAEGSVAAGIGGAEEVRNLLGRDTMEG